MVWLPIFVGFCVKLPILRVHMLVLVLVLVLVHRRHSTSNNKVPIADWDAENEILRGRENPEMNMYFGPKFDENAKLIREMLVEGELEGLSAGQIRDKVLQKMGSGRR